MPNEKLRRQIAHDAARLMYQRQESEYFRAKLKAARRLGGGWVKPEDLPSNREIRDEIDAMARLYEGERRAENLREMRVEALRLMRLLRAHKPRLIGSTLTGHVRRGSDIDIHVFADNVESVTGLLDGEGMRYDVERKRVRRPEGETIFTHIHIQDRFPVELTLYARDSAHVVMTSSITGKPIERMNIAELEEFLVREYPQELGEGDALEQALDQAALSIDRFQIYRMLLVPLEQVKQDPRYHPEGDALYHSLQVFDLAKDERPYDEELLLAALLHDVGKAIDPAQHVEAALEALGDFITPRTSWLIEHHMQAHAIQNRSIGARAKRRLAQSEDYDDLLLLGRCDRAGRAVKVEAPDMDEALDYLRELSEMCDGG